MTGSRSAIDAALDRLYPTERDFRMGLMAGPGEDRPPLAEIVAFRASHPVPHWHYVTYGLSELDEKTSSEPSVSGFGVEHTLRLVDPAPTPPTWPFQLLRWLARRTELTGYPYEHGHSMNLPSPMLEAYSPGVEGFAFYRDDELGEIDTPTGRLSFVQLVPLQRGEYELIGSWDAFRLQAELRTQSGDLLWRPGRMSVLDGPRAGAILAAIEREGSSQSVDFYDDLVPRRDELLLDSVGVRVLGKFLRHRVAHGRDARVLGAGGETRLEPGDYAYACDAGQAVLRVPAAEARALAEAIDAAPDGTIVSRPGGIRLRIDRRQ